MIFFFLLFLKEEETENRNYSKAVLKEEHGFISFL